MPDRLRIDSLLARKFQTYLNTGYALCASRMVAKTVTNFDGKQVSGRIFEPGAWSDYKDHAYAGYSGDSYPDTNINKLKVAGVGWDISHGRRFVSVFNSLYRERTFSGHSFPTDSDMQGLANQVVYGISNKDRKFPLFTNFSDSSNGWYRVGYHGAGSGHAPYGLCNSITSGGYGFWAEYNSDLGLVMDTLWHICQSVVAGVKTGTLGSLVVNTKINTIDASFYKEYYMGSRYYFEYVKSPPSLSTLDLELLHFLPTLGKWKNDYSSSESDCMSSDKVNCLEISSSNPFNASLRLKFKVSGQSFVSMKIYTASGRLVRTLVNSNNVYDGAHNTIWDGCDDSGQQLPSGSYLCRLSINGQKTAKRVILIR
ncbi:MAG: T9SS type A sorting domain-containing protein [Fibrobacteres bacterium]|nr:T9SS type A sorting domain-containing protein [Fibrobacterota bacterium]